MTFDIEKEIEKQNKNYVNQAKSSDDKLIQDNGWISVKDRLPLDGETVLCRGESYDADYANGYILARYYSYWPDKHWVIGKQEEEPTITHWMPLPPPPK